MLAGLLAACTLDTSASLTAGSIKVGAGHQGRSQDLMLSTFHRGRTATAIFAAILILASQAVGAAHFHEGAVSRNKSAVTQLAIDEALCPLCQFALHSPGSVSSAPAIARGPFIAETLLPTPPIRFVTPVFATARVRAPPVSF
jgi:hypothetical protein